MSMAPYRMVPTELTKLKKQIEVLLNKKFMTKCIIVGSFGLLELNPISFKNHFPLSFFYYD